MELLYIPLFAFLNRLRGGGWFAPKLPSRPLFWVFGFMLVMSFLIYGDQKEPLFVTYAYLVWGFFSWGRWYDLGHMPEIERKPNWMERNIERITKNNDTYSLLIRMAFATPLLLFVNVQWALTLPFLIVFFYRISWKIWPENPIPKAETMTGCAWGIIYLLAGAA